MSTYPSSGTDLARRIRSHLSRQTHLPINDRDTTSPDNSNQFARWRGITLRSSELGRNLAVAPAVTDLNQSWF